MAGPPPTERKSRKYCVLRIAYCVLRKSYAIRSTQYAILERGRMNVIKKLTHNIWTGFRYWVFRAVSYVSGKVPLRFAYWIGAVVGDFVYLPWKQPSANAVSNMRRVLGDSADWRVVKETARDSFRNYAKTLVD